MRSLENRSSGVREEASRTDQDDDRQDREGEGEVVAGADVAARKPQEEADHHSADQRAERTAEPAGDGRRQRDEEEAETEVRVEGADALGEDESRVTRDQAGEKERRAGDPCRVDAG